jgi:hypothetical protein
MLIRTQMKILFNRNAYFKEYWENPSLFAELILPSAMINRVKKKVKLSLCLTN